MKCETLKTDDEPDIVPDSSVPNPPTESKRYQKSHSLSAFSFKRLDSQRTSLSGNSPRTSSQFIPVFSSQGSQRSSQENSQSYSVYNSMDESGFSDSSPSTPTSAAQSPSSSLQLHQTPESAKTKTTDILSMFAAQRASKSETEPSRQMKPAVSCPDLPALPDLSSLGESRDSKPPSSSPYTGNYSISCLIRRAQLPGKFFLTSYYSIKTKQQASWPGPQQGTNLDKSINQLLLQQL